LKESEIDETPLVRDVTIQSISNWNDIELETPETPLISATIVIPYVPIVVVSYDPIVIYLLISSKTKKGQLIAIIVLVS
jgi:hypothetical protein